MPTETQYLRKIAVEIAAKKQLNNSSVPDDHLLSEAARLQKHITDHLLSLDAFTLRETFYYNTLGRLVEICDMLFEINDNVTPDVIVLVNLLTEIKKVVPSEINPKLKLPKAFIVLNRPEVTHNLSKYKQIMQQQAVDTKLIEIAAIPFDRFILGEDKLLWGDYTWLRGYQAKLDMINWENADCNSTSEALMSLLIGRNFNDDRFYVHCKQYIKDRAGKIEGKRARILEYAECEKLVMQDTQIGIVAYDVHGNHITPRLIKWIDEEIAFANKHMPEEPTGKLNFQFFKYTLAFFFKLLHEQKVFGDISFRELSKQIASSCTAMGANIGPDIMAKKAYTKKQIDFDMIENLLVKLLEYLRRFK
jgi:hypothetical protein